MKKLFYLGLTALMMLIMTGLAHAAPQLTVTGTTPWTSPFTGFSYDRYGRHVPLVITLTNNGTPLENFEVYYTMAGATPSKNKYNPNEEENVGIYRVIASGTTAELFFGAEEFPLKVIAYPAGTSTASNVVSLSMLALDVAEPAFSPASRMGGVEVELNSIVRITDNAGGSEIYYSTDMETTPLKSAWEKNDPNVFKYDDATGIKITKTTTIWAIAYQQTNGQWAGSNMIRGKFIVPPPTIRVAISPREYTIGEEAPIVRLTIPEGVTLGTQPGDIAVKLTCPSPVGYEQFITENNTSVDVSRAIAMNRENDWVIYCSLVKGENNAVAYTGEVSIEPAVMSMVVKKPGVPPEDPVFSVPSGQVYKYTKVTITSPTEGSTIYYTTGDGEIGTLYRGEVTISDDCFIRAMAEKDGLSSGVSSAAYTVIDEPLLDLTATVSPASGSEIPQGTSITITPSTTVDKILYKLYAKAQDGDNDQDFLATATEYSEQTKPVPTPATPVVRVGLMRDQQWKYFSFSYRFATVLTPTFNKGEGEVPKGTKITISCATPEATIHYTLDGNTPTTSSTVYTQPIEINENVTIKAIAVKQGMLNSKVAEIFYTIPNPLEFLTLSLTPPNGSQIDQGTEITIKPSITVEKIVFKLYATEDDLSYDETFNTTATEYTSTVKPAPTVENPVLRVGCMKEQTWKYFSYSYRVQGTEPPTPPTPPTPETVATPTFNPAQGEVDKGTKITIECTTPEATIHYTLDGNVPTAESTVYSEPIEINENVTIKAIAVKQEWTNSPMAEATYTVKEEQPEQPEDPEEPKVISLSFYPAGGSTVDANTEVTISHTGTGEIDIHYMMFSSEKEAKEAEWDQEKAQLYMIEYKPVLTMENTTIKATYTLDGETRADTFFYATYTVVPLKAMELRFRPASGSTVEDGEEIEVLANQETDIFYVVYADSLEAIASASSFIVEALVVEEDGNPVITKGNTFLKCGAYDKSIGSMKYFYASYKIKGEEPDPVVNDTVNTPAFSVPDGKVGKGTKVTIFCTTPEAMIFYTTNGEEPTVMSSLYIEPIEINESVTIQAIGYKVGMKKSKVGKASYQVDDVANEANELAGVSIYPNPNEGGFNVSVPVDAEVEVFTAKGVLVKHVDVVAGANAMRLENSGIYFVRVSANGQVAIKKVVVR